jgi:hypothetical protein
MREAKTLSLNGMALRVQLLIGLTAPLGLTVLCWLLGGRLAGSRRPGFRMWNEAGFWAMLIAAYVIFALALAGSRFFDRIDRDDPSPQLVQ